MLNYINNYHSKTLKHDLINKFIYNTCKDVPQLKKIILNFGCKNPENNLLITSLLALNLITGNKGYITRAKKSNIILKIRNGDPTGCKVTLQKANMFEFLSKILSEVFPKTKNFNKITLTKRIKKNAFSYKFKDSLNFNVLEKHYSTFKNLPDLNITIIADTKHKTNMKFFIKTLQLP